MSFPAKYHLHRSLGYQLSVAARLQERRLEKGLRQLGLTRISWCILLAVGNEALGHPSDIAKFVGIDRTATSRALRKMESDGLILRQSGTEDKRMTNVRLSGKGQTLLRKGTPLAQHNNAIMEQRLAIGEHVELHRLLSKLRGGENVELPGL